ncbi:MAG: protoheme IX farnesyltransferase, partial [Nitrospinae bacterium]|nr:protoheme IX farnesyltransferase [Nitrospinota bacterium]
ASGLGNRISALVMLPKPGIVALASASGFCGFYLGSGWTFNARLAFWTIFGLALATAGSTIFNNFADKDIDSIMKRTRGRSLPSGSLPAFFAYAAGTVCVTAALTILKVLVGPLVAGLTSAAVFIYVVLYTLYFKRSTPFATHIGGIAGAMPPLIGYAAAHGGLDARAFSLFLLIVVWQQPHFWSLALKYRKEYASAGIPVLPVAKGVEATKRRILLYVLLHFPVLFLPYYFGMAGTIYLGVSMALTLAYLALTLRFIFSDAGREMTVFHFSNVYLIIVFGVIMLDAR